MCVFVLELDDRCLGVMVHSLLGLESVAVAIIVCVCVAGGGLVRARIGCSCQLRPFDGNIQRQIWNSVYPFFCDQTK